MKFISLFAGIGGLDLGLERAGMQCVAQVEIDDFCQKVLQKNFPNVPKFKDVRNVGKHNLPAADLIAGGFPCQDVSLAGKRAGLEGKRSTLWSEFYRIVCEIRPRWVIIENVPGLLSSDNGEFFTKILRELSQSGYDAEWQSLPASAVGAPHRRDRVFVVAHPKEFIRNGGAVNGIWSVQSGGKKRKLRRQDFGVLPLGSSWALHQPAICRNDDGFPYRVDQLRALGNAVVPQVAEFIGRCIMEAS